VAVSHGDGRRYLRAEQVLVFGFLSSSSRGEQRSLRWDRVGWFRSRGAWFFRLPSLFVHAESLCLLSFASLHFFYPACVPGAGVWELGTFRAEIAGALWRSHFPFLFARKSKIRNVLRVGLRSPLPLFEKIRTFYNPKKRRDFSELWCGKDSGIFGCI